MIYGHFANIKEHMFQKIRPAKHHWAMDMADVETCYTTVLINVEGTIHPFIVDGAAQETDSIANNATANVIGPIYLLGLALPPLQKEDDSFTSYPALHIRIPPGSNQLSVVLPSAVCEHVGLAKMAGSQDLKDSGTFTLVVPGPWFAMVPPTVGGFKTDSEGISPKQINTSTEFIEEATAAELEIDFMEYTEHNAFGIV